MGYPGEKGRSGGAFPEQPPHEPHSAGQEFGNDAGGFGNGPEQGFGRDFGKEETPFAPREGAGSPWGPEPEQNTPAPGSFGQGGGGFGNEAFNEESRGQDAFGRDSYGPPQGDERFGQGLSGGDAFGQQGGGFGQEPPYANNDGFGDFGQGPDSYGPPQEPESKRGRNLPLIIGGAILAGAVLAGVGAGASGMFEPAKPKPKSTPAANNSKKPAPKPTPTQPKLDPVKLQSRQTDPQPLTGREVFGKASFKGDGTTYKRTAYKGTKGCNGTVTGTTLANAVKKGGCTQALRATYARGDGKLIGTVGILNLKTQAAAKAAQKAAGAKDSFLQPLAGTGITKKNGTGEALGTAEVRGHYLVMTWVQRPDGKKVPATAHKLVSAFGQQMIKGSGLSFALAYRETEGKPFKN